MTAIAKSVSGRSFLGKAFMTSSPLATQFAPQGSQAEQSETEQRNCRAAIGHPSPSDMSVKFWFAPVPHVHT